MEGGKTYNYKYSTGMALTPFEIGSNSEPVYTIQPSPIFTEGKAPAKVLKCLASDLSGFEFFFTSIG